MTIFLARDGARCFEHFQKFACEVHSPSAKIVPIGYVRPKAAAVNVRGSTSVPPPPPAPSRQRLPTPPPPVDPRVSQSSSAADGDHNSGAVWNCDGVAVDQQEVAQQSHQLVERQVRWKKADGYMFRAALSGKTYFSTNPNSVRPWKPLSSPD